MTCVKSEPEFQLGPGGSHFRALSVATCSPEIAKVKQNKI